ncbi:MAG: AbrB/MazE/SpoVT family DNA-binding domain-containing protein [Devosia sp.]|nr:AbrB/MazE/SpoVT family DNA-binding domain-containing protein [Devosia sp.]
MTFVTITSKGQMTLPKEIRDDLKVKAGDRLIIEKHGGGYVLRPHKSVDELYGVLHAPGEKAMTVEEIDEALGRALAEDDERIRAGR